MMIPTMGIVPTNVPELSRVICPSNPPTEGKSTISPYCLSFVAPRTAYMSVGINYTRYHWRMSRPCYSQLYGADIGVERHQMASTPSAGTKQSRVIPFETPPVVFPHSQGVKFDVIKACLTAADSRMCPIGPSSFSPPTNALICYKTSRRHQFHVLSCHRSQHAFV